MADLKLKDLKYLVAIADTRHFGQAAAKCFVSQPTLSAQLKKLEEYLGVQLIERAPRQVTMTPAGAEICTRARRILESSDDIIEIARAHRDPLAGRLRVGFLPTIGPYLLPDLTPRLSRALPRIEFLLYEYQTAPMLERLHANELDLGILALPVDLDGLAAKKLYDEPFVVALPARHRLAKHPQLQARELQGETLLLLEDGHCLRDQALDVCSRTKIFEHQNFRGTSIETLRQMVATGAGITLLPLSASHGPYAQARGVAIRPLVSPVPTRTIGAIWRKSSARLAAIAAVNELLAASGPAA